MNSTVTPPVTKLPDCLHHAGHPSRTIPTSSSHSQSMNIFSFHRNCTSQSHGMAGSQKAGGSVNSAVTTIFTKPLDYLPLTGPLSRDHSYQWLPFTAKWIFFPFHRNCTSQRHVTTGSYKAGSFVNSAVID